MIGLFIQATSMEGTRNVLLVLTGQQEKVLNLQGNESLIATVINGMDLALPETPVVPDNGTGEPRQVCIPHILSELAPEDKFKLVMSNPPPVCGRGGYQFAGRGLVLDSAPPHEENPACPYLAGLGHPYRGGYVHPVPCRLHAPAGDWEDRHHGYRGRAPYVRLHLERGGLL